MIDRTYYTPEEVSKMFKLSLSTIYNLIDKGELPSVKIGKCYRIPHAELADYLKSRTRRSGGVSRGSKIPVVSEFIKLLESSDIKDNVITVVLFGSYARRDFGPDSDIDILVILKEHNNNINDAVSELSDAAMASADYEDFLSVIQMSEDKWKESEKLNSPFYKSVTGDGIVLWKK